MFKVTISFVFVLMFFSFPFQDCLSQSMLDISAESTWFEAAKDDVAVTACIHDVVTDMLGLSASDSNTTTLPEPLTLSMLEDPSLRCSGYESQSSGRTSTDSGISSLRRVCKGQRRTLAKKLKKIGRSIHQGNSTGMDLKTLAVL